MREHEIQRDASDILQCKDIGLLPKDYQLVEAHVAGGEACEL